MRFTIDRTWNGDPAAPGEIVHVDVVLERGFVNVSVDAPFHGDIAPPARPGRLDGLWEFEVVELFVLGPDERYLEIELGPHGHYLALQLEGRRRAVRRDIELPYEACVRGRRWRATTRVPAGLLPPAPYRGNAYAIHGAEPARRFLAAFPRTGCEESDLPDFHRLETFREFDPTRNG